MSRIPLLSLLLSVLLPLTACNREASAPDTTPPAPTVATTPSAEATAAAAAAAADAGTATPAATPAPANDPAAPAAVASIATPGDGAPLVAGTDYAEIPGGQPLAPLNGKVEVVEVFGYVCPACARFQPLVSAWEKTLPADVRFTYVPAAFGPEWAPYANAFHVAESMGLVGKTHDAIYNAIHIAQTLPGEGKKPDEAAVAAFYGKYGANPTQFLDAMRSFATNAKLTRGKQFMIRSGVTGTPTLIVNGKYRILGSSYEDMLRITNQLIAQERGAGAAGQ